MLKVSENKELYIGYAPYSRHQQQMLSSLGQTHTPYTLVLDFRRPLCIMKKLMC
jgi:hypothetical protein